MAVTIHSSICLTTEIMQSWSSRCGHGRCPICFVPLEPPPLKIYSSIGGFLVASINAPYLLFVSLDFIQKV